MAITVPARFDAYSNGLKTQRSIRTLCRCVSIEFMPVWQRTPSFDSSGFHFTNHGRDLRYQPTDQRESERFTFGERVFRPRYAPTFSQIRKARGIRPHTFELRGPYAPNSDLGITREDLTVGRIINAKVSHYWVDHRRPFDETPFVDVFYVNGREYGENGYTLFCESMVSRLSVPRGNIETVDCQNDLGDSICGGIGGVDLDDVATHPEYRIDSALAQSTGQRRELTLRFTPLGASPHTTAALMTANWFAFGTVEPVIAPGDINAGQTRKIVSSTQAQLVSGTTYEITVRLYSALPGNIQFGTDWTVRVGCDKLANTCTSKFDNFKRFLGTPYIIGTDRLQKSGNAT